MKEYSAYSTVLGFLKLAVLQFKGRRKHSFFISSLIFIKSSSGHTAPKYINNTSSFFHIYVMKEVGVKWEFSSTYTK